MDFELYKTGFEAKAVKQGKERAFIDRCLEYAENLYNYNLPVIFDMKHFSQLVGIDVEYIGKITNCQNKFYKKYTIPKRNGGERTISEPLPMLKQIQRYILDEILLNVPCSKYSKAFKKRSSIKENAKFHRGQKYICKIDIKDYFPTISNSMVYKLFFDMGYNKPVSTLLTNLCTLNYSLPQGAPTSPYISNLVTRDLDESLYDLCSRAELRYTRYADDICISGETKPTVILPEVFKTINANGFRINYKKIAILSNGNRQSVTGIVVNKKIQINKDYRHLIRQEMYYINKYGLRSHMERRGIVDQLKYRYSLLGKISFCLQINPKDLEMQEYKKFFLEIRE